MLYNNSNFSNYFMGKGMTFHFLNTKNFFVSYKIEESLLKEIGCKNWDYVNCFVQYFWYSLQFK